MFTEDVSLVGRDAVLQVKQLQMFCEDRNAFMFRDKKFRRPWILTNTAVRT
jgi:hypothetical protein